MNKTTNILASAFIALPLIAAIGGCAATQEKATDVMDKSLDGQFTSYDDLRTYPGQVTCGKYTVITASGDVEERDFIVIETTSIMRPKKRDLAVFCSEDPKASLNASLGIDYDAQKPQIDAILADFEMLEAPLLAYEKDNIYFPWSDQGLDALVTPSTKGNPPRNFPEGGYIGAIPKDPWGNAYDYVCPPFAGVRVMYKLQSLGADGVKGGTGINTDIKSTYLKYFRHIENL